ncbi:MAG: CBS domain-containing protein [Myxococcota bacterium]
MIDYRRGGRASRRRASGPGARAARGRCRGMCVVDDDGKLVGVVTGMDLVFPREAGGAAVDVRAARPGHQFGARKTVRELEKVGAMTVDDLMTRRSSPPPQTPLLETLATRMVEDHVSMIPVVEDGRPVGVITRRVMIATALRHLLGDEPKP